MSSKTVELSHHRQISSVATTLSDKKAIALEPTDDFVFIDLDPEKDAQEIEGILHTYWHMKERQWNRTITSTFTNASKTFSFFYIVIIALCALSYFLISLAIFNRYSSWIVEYAFMLILSGSSSWYYMPGYYIPYLFGCVLTMLFSMFVYSTHFRLRRFYISQLRRKIGSIKKIVQGENNIRYEIQQHQFFGDPHLCVIETKYSGLPDGESLWIDTSSRGEYITGWFENGEPVGPFVSIENTTRNVLHSLRIIFATDAKGKYTNHRQPLHYGVAGVECCVSGDFFAGYPRCRFITGPKLCECEGECTCVENVFSGDFYKHADDNKPVENLTVAIDEGDKLCLSGFYGDADEVKLTYENGQIGIDERWLPLTGENSEALVYIHGLNHTLVDALKRLGQLLALGHFPKNIIPFTFSWPSCTNVFLYCCAANVSSDNAVHRDFRRFLYSLKNSKLKKIHVLAHSLGTRFFLQSFSMLKELFAETKDFGTDHGKLEVANLILLSSDYDSETFQDDYPDFISFTKHVTIYADSRDMALRSSNTLLRGKRVGQTKKPFVDKHGEKLKHIDIIDTGDLERNIDGANHGFFNINNSMIEDLQELICTGKTASERETRLVKTNDIFHFTLLPRSVKM
ncbi:DUF676 domain-containing protein [Entamoeba marina]